MLKKIGITLGLTPQGEQQLVVVLENDVRLEMRAYLEQDGVDFADIKRELDRIVEKVNAQLK